MFRYWELSYDHYLGLLSKFRKLSNTELSEAVGRQEAAI